MNPEDNPADEISEVDWWKGYEEKCLTDYWDGLKPNLELPEAFNVEAWDE